MRDENEEPEPIVPTLGDFVLPICQKAAQKEQLCLELLESL
jgi:hypothetical protein